MFPDLVRDAYGLILKDYPLSNLVVKGRVESFVHTLPICLIVEGLYTIISYIIFLLFELRVLSIIFISLSI